MGSHKITWQVKRLEELCQFQNGYSFKNKDYQNNFNDGYMVFRMGNINRGGGMNRDASPVYISQDQSTGLRRFVLDKNDIVMCMTDMKSSMNLLGHTALIDKSDYYILNQRVGRITVTRKDTLDYRYLFYYTNNKTYLEHLRSVAHSGVQVNLSTKAIRESPILFPPLPTQRKIAAVLSAYDDLIENNTRRIEILEEMAAAIYREWFVEFHFPGHEGVEMVESELGLIPQGWEVVRLSDIVETQYGYTESATEDEVGPKFVRGTDINKTSYIDWSTVPFCPIESKKYVKYQLHIGDILVIRMADPGKVAIIEKETDAVFASYLIRLKLISNRLSPYYLFFTLLDRRYQNYIYGASTGTTRKSASAGVVTDFALIVPTDELKNHFEGVIGVLRKTLNNLLEKNANLHKTRDLLLPKLISGEIDVSELDVDTD